MLASHKKRRKYQYYKRYFHVGILWVLLEVNLLSIYKQCMVLHVHITLTQIADENAHGENWKVLFYMR